MSLVERGRTAYQKSSTLQFRNGIFIILLGVCLLVVAGLALAKGQASEWTVYLLVSGVLFAGMGISSLVSAKRFREK